MMDYDEVDEALCEAIDKIREAKRENAIKMVLVPEDSYQELIERVELLEDSIAFHATKDEPTRPIEEFIEEMEEEEAYEEPDDDEGMAYSNLSGTIRHQVAQSKYDKVVQERDEAIEDRDNAWKVVAGKNATIIEQADKKADLIRERDDALEREMLEEQSLRRMTKPVNAIVGQRDEARAELAKALALLNEQDGLQEQLDSLQVQLETKCGDNAAVWSLVSDYLAAKVALSMSLEEKTTECNQLYTDLSHKIRRCDFFRRQRDEAVAEFKPLQEEFEQYKIDHPPMKLPLRR